MTTATAHANLPPEIRECMCPSPMGGMMLDPDKLAAFLAQLKSEYRNGCATPMARNLPAGCVMPDMCDYPVGPAARIVAVAAGATVPVTIAPSMPTDVHFLYIQQRTFSISGLSRNNIPRAEGFIPSGLYAGVGGPNGGLIPMRIGVVSITSPFTFNTLNTGLAADDFDFAFLGIAKPELSK